MSPVLSRRKFLVGTSIAAGSALLAACQPTPTAAPATAAPEEATVAPTVVAAKVPLLYWQYMTDQEEVETVILKDFMAANADIELTWQYIPWQEYWTKLNASLAAGTPPDVWNTAPTFYYDYILRKQLADITDLFNQNFKLDDFFPAAMSGYDFRGKYYGIPRNIVTTCNWFNIDLFEQAAVEPPPLDGNWTWDDYLTKAQGVVKALNTGDKITTFGASATQSFGWWLGYAMIGNGCEWAKNFSRDLVGMEIDLTGESCVATVKYMSDLINEYKVAPAAGEFEGQGDPFLTGRLAQIWNLPWVLGGYKDAPFKWDVNLPPKGAAEQITYGGADGLVLSEPSKAKNEAWRLMMWLLDFKTGGDFMYSTGALPPVKDKEILDTWASRFEGKNIAAVIASSDIAVNRYCLGYGELVSALTTELENVFLGNLSAEEGCAKATQVGNEKLKSILQQYQEAMGG
ncbi:MAG: ABC transporter substrate-binding protein [Anaerolineae bacterium]